MTNPTIEDLKRAKLEFERNVGAHIALQMEEFQRQTGLPIYDVKLDFIEHLQHGNFDKAVLLHVEARIHITVEVEDNLIEISRKVTP